MKLKKNLNMFKNDEKGAVVIIVALFMTVLLGFSALALDLGLRYDLTSRLQKGLDSIALAAVRELPADNTSSPKWTNAVNAAKKYAELNKVTDITESSLVPVYEDGKIIGLTVNGEKEVSYNFAKIFGINQSTVNKKATAKLMKVSGVSGLLPLALPKAVIDEIIANNLIGQDITLKLGPKIDDVADDDLREDFAAEFNIAGNSGWRGAINFVSNENLTNSLPGGDYKNAMENGGFDQVVNIGDPVATNAGNMPVNVEGKISIGQTFTVPVIDFDAYHVLRVVGFVTFQVTNLEGNNEGQKKISILTSSYVSNYIAAGDTETGVVLNDYGVRAAKLVDY